jgi:hypothetical protein
MVDGTVVGYDEGEVDGDDDGDVDGFAEGVLEGDETYVTVREPSPEEGPLAVVVYTMSVQ